MSALPRVASDQQVAEAVEALRRGEVTIIPTDTVYGLAASLDHPIAIDALYELKGRPSDRPIPILVSDFEAVARLAAGLPAGADALMERFWPGALTVVVRASRRVPREVLSGGQTVGLRMPASGDALEVIGRCGGALAVTSANRSGEPEARTAAEAARLFAGRVTVVVDGGPAPGGVPSSVVDLTASPPRIVRHGAIAEADIDAVLGPSGERE